MKRKPVVAIIQCMIAAVLLIACRSTAQASLLAYYPFQGSAQDTTGHGYNGTIVGNTSLAAGYYGQGYYFDGSGDYISLPLNINPSVYPQLTMGAWVKAANGSPVRQVISHDNGSFDRSLGIDSRGGGTGWSAFSGSGAVLGYSPITLGQWTFVAATYNQATSQVALYVNGTLYSETGSLGAGNTITRIGSNPGFGEYFNGVIDEVFFFDTALNSAQLDALRRNGLGGSTEIPEPATLSLLGLGLCSMIFTRRAKKI
jgi:hypothetical protein